jgi:hypothetical protein
MKYKQWLLAVVVVKTFIIGRSDYLPTGEEAKEVLERTKHLWRCDKGQTPRLALDKTTLTVQCTVEK